MIKGDNHIDDQELRPASAEVMCNAATDRLLMDASLRSEARPLIVFQWKNGVIVEQLKERSLIVGRSTSCDVTIEDPLLAPEHARVTLAGDEIWIDNLSPTLAMNYTLSIDLD